MNYPYNNRQERLLRLRSAQVLRLRSAQAAQHRPLSTSRCKKKDFEFSASYSLLPTPFASPASMSNKMIYGGCFVLKILLIMRIR